MFASYITIKTYITVIDIHASTSFTLYHKVITTFYIIPHNAKAFKRIKKLNYMMTSWTI